LRLDWPRDAQLDALHGTSEGHRFLTSSSRNILFEGYRLGIALISKLLSAVGIVVLVCSTVLAVASNEEIKNFLPDKIGETRANGKADLELSDKASEGDYEKEFVVSRLYRSVKGGDFLVSLVKTRTDRGAYSLFTTEAQKLTVNLTKVDGLGTAAVTDSSGRLLVYKGLTFLSISDQGRVKNSDNLVAFARSVVAPLDKGDGEIPVLVKHLPDWESFHPRAVYALSLPVLQFETGQRPILDSISFAGGTEAVTALYGTSRLVIIELATPQLATDGDARVIARIDELRTAGQPTPSAYRRVGNYAVFVFDAPDEATANQLIDKVAYEKVVQWLGDNPNWFLRAEREYRQTTAGVILAVFKASGISLLICLGIGGIFGGIVFRRRRAQQATREAYSDAGGMLRLNLDEMTPEVDPSRLLGKGDG
jgi:hypothetical protein